VLGGGKDIFPAELFIKKISNADGEGFIVFKNVRESYSSKSILVFQTPVYLIKVIVAITSS